MSENWSEIRVQDACDTLRSKRRKLLARDYGIRGRFPIVDQGQEAIAGWSDDESLVVSDELPLIVFGDHSRTFKYIDQPFIVGADGTQLLKPNKSIDPLFFYFACRNLDIPSRGYNRHFTILKEKTIRYPDLPLQRKIAAILRKIQQAIEVETNLIRVTRELKAAVMKKLFTEGLNGETQKETDIGMVPESWKVSELREFVTIKSGGTPSRDKPEYWNEGTIPWVKTGEVDYCVITDTSERITEAGMENSAAKIFPSGTLLMAMYGQGVTRGKVALLGIPATTNQACAAIFPDDRVTSLFLYHFLEFQYETIRGMGHGANQKNLNSDIIKAIKCPIPSPAEQSAICRCLDTLNSSLLNLERRRVVLESLFQSSLQNLMSGSIRVTDLLLDSSLSFESQGVAA
jgi:type I restriction enzyme S subunit